MKKWNELTLREKYPFISEAIALGVKDLDLIKTLYAELSLANYGAYGMNLNTPPYTSEIDDVEDYNFRNYFRQLAEARAEALNKKYTTDEFEPEDLYDHLMGDSTYNYRRWYNLATPEEREEHLIDALGHFPDARGKTYLHPTASIESPYSGYVNPYNPLGLVFGNWLSDNRYVFSEDLLNNNWPINYTLDELEWARNNENLSVYAFDPQGGQMLREVEVVAPVLNQRGEGGNLFDGKSTNTLHLKNPNPSVVDDELLDWVIREEGFISEPTDIGDGKRTIGSGLTASKWHELYRQRGNKWSAEDNRSAVKEELSSREKKLRTLVPNWESLPDNSKKALLSYNYNYNFTRKNSPKMFEALDAGNMQLAALNMNATSKNPKFKKGLMQRRLRELSWFLGEPSLAERGERYIEQKPDILIVNTPDRIPIEYTVPKALYIPASNIVPDLYSTAQAPNYVEAAEIPPQDIGLEYFLRALDALNRWDKLQNNTRLYKSEEPRRLTVEDVISGSWWNYNPEAGNLLTNTP